MHINQFAFQCSIKPDITKRQYSETRNVHDVDWNASSGIQNFDEFHVSLLSYCF